MVPLLRQPSEGLQELKSRPGVWQVGHKVLDFTGMSPKGLGAARPGGESPLQKKKKMVKW